jgi:FkbM family methyltransferase
MMRLKEAQISRLIRTGVVDAIPDARRKTAPENPVGLEVGNPRGECGSPLQVEPRPDISAATLPPVLAGSIPASVFGAIRRVARRASRTLRRRLRRRFERRVRKAFEKTSLPLRLDRLEALSCEARAAEQARAEAQAAALDRVELSVHRNIEQNLQRAVRSLDHRLGLRHEYGILRLDDTAAQISTRIEVIEARLNSNAGILAAFAETVGRIEQTATVLLTRVDQALDVLAKMEGAAEILARPPALPLGQDYLVLTPDGYLLVPSEDNGLLATMLSNRGVLEPGTRRILSALLHEGARFADVGAHVGTMTLLGARVCGSTGRVFAIEPTPRTAALLRRTLALNGVEERVTLHACAAGATTGTASLHLCSVFGHNSLLPLDEATSRLDVSVRTLDELVPPKLPLDVVKIDAEGFELEVWRGMRRIVSESPSLAVIVEFGPSHLRRAGLSVRDWLGELHASGFTMFEIDEATGSCRRLRDEAELGRVFSLNLLLLRCPAAHPELVLA